ncbi:MAG TPA: helix-hairpin-helix domain-containing protein [Thermomicrobiales bacterium]|nr:helix-hairpin-helix domain-containing protein [Thermomicrobiales bacterium]
MSTSGTEVRQRGTVRVQYEHLFDYCPNQESDPTMAHVTNKDAAALLFNVATILELADDNPYRIRAYRRAARLLLARPQTADVNLVEGKHGKELDLPGLGQRLRRKLGELLSTGRMRFYVELCAELPADVATLMQIPGVGPKTALRLHEELGLTTPAEVVAAADAGKLRALYGFGQKRERQIMAGAAEVVGGNVRTFVPRPPVERAGPVSIQTGLPVTLPEAA